MVVLRRDRMRRREILRRLLRCRDGDVVLLNGALSFDDRWIDLFYGLAVRIRGRRVALVVKDATWHSRSTRSEARVPTLHGAVEVFGKTLLRAVCGPHTHVCFLSRQEVTDFVQQARVPAERVHFTPYFATLTREEERQLLALRAAGVEPYVFSGGNSSRDYALLVEALAGSGHRVEVATRAALPWPDNFRAGPVPHDQFLQKMARAAVVVVPLDTRTRRGVGQQTYLNAMLLGIPVVLNDAVGVRDLVRHGHDALVVPPRDPAALRAAVDRVLDPAHRAEVQQMAEAGRATATEFGPEAYFGRLRRLMHTVERGLTSTE